MTESNQNKNNSFDSLNYSSVITVRLPDFIKREIQQDSVSNHITVNANVAKILIQHIEWSQFVQESGFVYINRTFLKELLKSIDIKHVENISKEYCVENLKTSICSFMEKSTKTPSLKHWKAG